MARRGSLEIRAEVTKLARLLGVEPGDLSYLERLPADAVRELREQVTDALFSADRAPLRRVAISAGVTPVAVSAQLAQRAFGPLLCARIAGEVDPGRAVDIAKRLPDSFLAEVAIELDPRRARDVIARIPTARIVAVGRELARRREYVTMGRFVGYVSAEALRSSIAAIDDEALLRTAFVLEGKGRLDDVVASLPEERLRGLTRTAAEAGLWPETLDLLCHLDPELRGLLADVAAAEPDEVLDAAIRAAHEEELWDSLLPVVRAMGTKGRRRFATLPAIQEEAVIDALVDVAARQRLWPELLPVVPLLPADAQRRLVTAAAELDPALLEEVLVGLGQARAPAG